MLRLLLIGVLALSASGCALMPGWTDDKGHLMHVVLVWLKEPGNEAHRRQIIQASRVLAEIPGVREVRAGAVVPGERDVVRDDFDVGLVIRVADRAALQAYLDHPLHVSTVRTRMAPLMARYEVMDFASP